MKTNTAGKSATIESASPESNPLDAFEAGLKSQTPVEVFPGIFIHHKDLIRTDLRPQFMEEEKASKPGPINPAGTLTLLTPESFGRAITDHRDVRTKVFADNEKSEIVAVFDFLETGGRAKAQDARQSGWGQLRAQIAFSESPQAQGMAEDAGMDDPVRFRELPRRSP
jgi:hypothetical protein